LGGRVSGPSTIGAPDTYEWDAYAFGGTGSQNYQWKYKNDGSSTWNSLGTYAYQARYVDGSTPDFTMRVIITSGSDTVVKDTSVDVNFITSVGLTGTSWVHPWITCSWTATPEGGTPPYIYEWTGSPESLNAVDTTSGPDTFYSTAGDYSFWITVTVTAANGGQGYTYQEVTVDEGGPGC
jgi:hypothetical protein